MIKPKSALHESVGSRKRYIWNHIFQYLTESLRRLDKKFLLKCNDIMAEPHENEKASKVYQMPMHWYTCSLKRLKVLDVNKKREQFSNMENDSVPKGALALVGRIR